MTTATPPSTLSKRVMWGVALIALVAHLGIGVGGVWSFEPLNYDDPQVLSLAADTSVADLFTETVWYAYKPIYFLSLKIDTLFDDVSAVAHVHNALLHALAAGLLVLVLLGMTRRLWLAGAVGLVFALQPVHVESVAWIASRKDVLSLVLVLCAHLLYVRARDAGRMSWAAPLLLLLGGLAKGTVWVWAGVLLLDEILHRMRASARGERLPIGAVALRLAPCFLVAFGGILLDGWIATSAGPGSVDHGVGTASLAAAMAGVHARYVLHAIAPIGLSIDYAIDPAGSWASPWAWAGLALLVGALGLFFVSWRRGRPLGTLAAGLWLLGLLPVNNLWPRTAILMADRYLYLPAVGLYLLLLALLARWRAGRGLVLGVVAVVLLVLCGTRTGVFRDSPTVWADATEKVPTSALAWFQRGQAAAARGAWTSAEEWATRAIEEHPRPEIRVKAHLLRTGAILGAAGAREARGLTVDEADLARALAEANEARRLAAELTDLAIVREDPRLVEAEAQVLRGKVLERWRDPASALEAYEDAVRLAPRHATAHYDYATLLASIGTAKDLQLAEAHLETALQHRPSFLDAEIQLATVVALQGRADDALKVLERARGRHGRSPELLFAQAQVHLAARQDVVQAEALLQELKRVAPSHPKASRLLRDIRLAQGRILLQKGRAEGDRANLRAALERFDRAGDAQARSWEAEVGAGDALVHLGRYREARRRFRQALDWSRDLPWIRRLVARTGVLEAAWTARYAEDDQDRLDAARIAAGALAADVTAIDLGFLRLGRDDLAWLARVSPRLDVPEAAEAAGRVLRAAVLATTGDEEGARREISGVLTTLSPNTEESALLDATLLLRARLRERSADVDGAERDYRLLADRRPDDPLPELARLALALRRARHALDVSRANPEDAQQIAVATAGVDAAARAIGDFADAHLGLLGSGLLATEADMHRGRWVPALRRLNGLKTRFARDPAVYRGQAAIYVTQYLGSRERTLLMEGERALRQALTLDPRDPQTLLDASQLARIAGDLNRSLEYARLARSSELVPNGPAARALAGLHVAIGRQALERGDGNAALQAVDAARAADRGSAAPWLLRGDVLFRGQKLDLAIESYRTAKELEPWSDAASEGLAKAHRQQATVFRWKAASLKAPPRPERADPEAWAALSESEREAATARWEQRAAQVKQTRGKWQRQELRAVEAALRLDADAEESEELRRRLEVLRPSDPAADRRAVQEANVVFEEGLRAYGEGRLSVALRSFQEATDIFANHLPAHVYSALCALAFLSVPGERTPEELEVETGWWLLAFEGLHAADTLDPMDLYPSRHRVRGALHDLRWRQDAREEDRISARRAYERFLRAMEAKERSDDPEVAIARRRLKALAE